MIDLHQLPAPEPNADLLPRILRSRALGVRVTLPVRGPAVPWHWLAAAALVTALIGGSWKLTVWFSEFREARVGARDPVGELLRGRLWSSEESPRDSAPETLEPRYPLIRSGVLDISRLSEGVWTYQSMRTDGILSEPSLEGGDRLRVTRSSYGGQSAWMVETAGRFHAQPWSVAETVYVDATTLRPRYAVAYANKHRARLVESFTDGRGFQSISFTGPMKGSYSGIMELKFPSDALFTNDWSLGQEFRVLMPAIPLARGWQGSLYQTGFFARSGPGRLTQRAFPLNLRVAGTDRVLVPAGRFDCWRVEVESFVSGTEAWEMWISRDKGWVVKAEFRRSDYVRDEVLERYEPLNP